MILSYIRTVILYLVLILVIRLMGKRQIGEMEPAEFVVTMLVANLAAIPMQDAGIPLLTGLIPILTVLGVELVLSWLMLCSGPLRRLFCGKPVLLIDNGRLLQGNLRMTRVTLDELFGKLRFILHKPVKLNRCLLDHRMRGDNVFFRRISDLGTDVICHFHRN